MKQSYQVWGILVMMVFLTMESSAQVNSLFAKKKKYQYRYVDTDDMIKRYISKSSHPMVSIEGIYSVSGTVTKKGKNFLSGEYKEKVVDRKDNYANIAILRDWSDSENEFIVLSLKQDDASQYPIVAELTTLSEGRGFLCKHFEPDGKIMTFTFTFDGDSDILEGIFTKQEGSKTVTYSITYLKTFPKNEVLNN